MIIENFREIISFPIFCHFTSNNFKHIFFTSIFFGWCNVVSFKVLSLLDSAHPMKYCYIDKSFSQTSSSSNQIIKRSQSKEFIIPCIL